MIIFHTSCIVVFPTIPFQFFCASTRLKFSSRSQKGMFIIVAEMRLVLTIVQLITLPSPDAE